ncbi:MAG: hypothetical protein ACO23H_20050, partial [Alphaproteobacteria bacterium]
ADLTTNGNDIIFGDNDKAIFGAGSDLQIYHDGSNSFISDQGSGSLVLRGSTAINLQNGAGTEYLARFFENGSVNLYYDNSLKLATASTGVNVTGTVTADDVQSDLFGAADGTVSNPSIRNIGDSNTGFFFPAADTIGISTGGNQRINISSGGDVSLFEDTGTSAKFFWDSSAESLGIGTSSTFGKVTSTKSGGMSPAIDNFDGIGYSLFGSTSSGEGQFGGGIAFQNGSVKRAQIGLVQTGSDNDQQGLAIFTHPSGTYADDLEVAMVVGYGTENNVGIGTNSPTAKLESLSTSAGSDSAALHLRNASDTANTEVRAYFTPNTSTALNRSAYVGAISETAGNDSELVFGTNASGAAPAERMRIDASGHVGIGTDSPASLLTTKGDDALLLRSTGSDNYGFHVTVDHGTDMAKLGALDSADGSKDGSTITFGDFGRDIRFSTNKGASLAEAMRIDSSGNLLVGKTSAGISTVGVEARSIGVFSAT